MEKTPTPTRDVILEEKLNLIFSRHQVALESLNYDHSTQNQKLHQTVVKVCFRKKSSLTVTFHSTSSLFCNFRNRVSYKIRSDFDCYYSGSQMLIYSYFTDTNELTEKFSLEIKFSE